MPNARFDSFGIHLSDSFLVMKSNNTICMTHPNFVIVVKHKPVEPLTNKNRLKRNVYVFVLPIWEDQNPTAYHKSRTTAV